MSFFLSQVAIEDPIRFNENMSEFDEYDDDYESDTIDCPDCGAAVYEDSPCCPRCGNYISEQRAPATKTKQIIVILLVVTMAVISGYCFCI